MAGGSRVISCVVDPLFPDQPKCKCHLGFKTSEAGICVGMGYNFLFELSTSVHLLDDRG